MLTSVGDLSRNLEQDVLIDIANRCLSHDRCGGGVIESKECCL
jgi:hypothetical protein